VFLILNILFGGFFIGTDTIPKPLEWLKWLSFVNYAFQSLVINQYKDTASFAVVDEILQIDFVLWVGIVGLISCVIVFQCFWYCALRFNKPKFDHSL